MRREQIVEPGLVEHEPEALARRIGPDATRPVEAVENVVDAGHRLEAGAEPAIDLGLLLLEEVGRQRMADLDLDDGAELARGQSGEADGDLFRRDRITELEEKFANPYVAAERGFVDEVIEPSQTRPKLIRALKLLENKRDTNPSKKHGNIPL